jgi:hypothetical protein
MNAQTKTRRMLKQARIAYAKAEAADDRDTMAEIEEKQIDPLRALLRKMTLGLLLNEADKLNGLSEAVEASVRELQGRIDRFFLDDFIAEAKDLDLIPETTGRGPIAGRMAAPPVAAAAAATPRSARTGSVEGARRIPVTDTDLDALMRVAKSEVGHFGQYGEAQLRGGLAAVVDTVFNRVAHDKYPDTIQDVIDQPAQFSAINSTGSWTGLPQAPGSVAKIVTEHVRARAQGQTSELEGATHFLNPYISSESAMRQWGQHVKDNPVAIYGSDANKDVHYHGFAPGATQPDSHVIAFEGEESLFDGSGRAPSGTPSARPASSHADIRRRIVEICNAEFEFFNRGQAKEIDDPQYLRVGDYWRAVGSGNNGRTLNAAGQRPAWSAAFVSFVLKEAGAGNRFLYSAGHCDYFQHFVDRSGPLLYQATLVTDFVPRQGDILHYGRGDAKQHDFAAARADFGDDGWYPSHSDIVVSVDIQAKKVTAIGGNVGNSVKQKTYALDAGGFLKDRKEGSQTFPWIGMLRLI